MSPPKVKNLIILVLALVNIFLLALVVPSRVEDLQQRQQANEALAALYAQAGVSLAPESIPKTAALYPLDLSAADPAHALALLLGQDMTPRQTESGTHYVSSRGSAECRSDGTVTLTLTEPEPVSDPEHHARELLQAMDIPCHQVQQTDNGANITVTALAAADRTPIFSPALQFFYRDGAFTGLSGVLLTASDPVEVSSEACISAADALTVFLRSRMSVGWVGSSVEAVRQGFSAARDPALSLWHLQPVWKISTDSGSYLVDSATCAVSFCPF